MGKVGIGLGVILSIFQGFFVAYPLWRIMVITDLLENTEENNIGQADANYVELTKQTALNHNLAINFSASNSEVPIN